MAVFLVTFDLIDTAGKLEVHLGASDMSLSLTLSGLTTLSLCACNYIHVCTAALKTLQAAMFHLHRNGCFGKMTVTMFMLPSLLT